MTDNRDSPVLGIFTDQARAEQTVDKLHQAGFRDQVRVLTHEHITGKSAPGSTLAGRNQGETSDILQRALLALAIPTDELAYYHKELESGRTLLIVQADARSQEAHDILHSHGAYNARAPHDRQADLSPGTDNMHVRKGEYNPNIPQGAGM